MELALAMSREDRTPDALWGSKPHASLDSPLSHYEQAALSAPPL
jgi:hypothetical protein